MRHSVIKIALFFLAFTIIIVNPGLAQKDCKVSLDKISGEYDGGCKKGLANGQGTAKGEDTYVGTFKKGLPHGNGTYTWANGDVYTGEFKKGLKDGEGKMTIKKADGQTEEKTGFWSKDKYLGMYEKPYKVRSKTSGVLSIRFTETETIPDEGPCLLIETRHKGKTQMNPSFGFSENTGSFSQRFQVGTDHKVLVSTFPFGFTINYMDERIEINIYQEASWKISIDYNKD